MTRLTWDEVGSRRFETGLDRGVLYVDEYPGVSWSGLISVSESPTAGEATGYYLDGVKYLNDVPTSEFAATINAYYYPLLFEQCDGYVSTDGLTFTDQARSSFGLSYRTRLGNDSDGSDYAYKLHLIYNAYISPSSRDYQSLTGSVDPMSLSWAISAKPIVVPGYRPCSHFIVDSTKLDSRILSALEDVLYGTTENVPRLPTIAELIDLLADGVIDADGGSASSVPSGIYDGGPAVNMQTSTVDGGTA